MSEKNKQIIEAVNQAFMDNKPEGFLEHCKEDVIWSMAGHKTCSSKDDIREWMKEMGEMPAPQFTVDRLFAGEDMVACYGEMTMPGSDKMPGTYSYCDVYRFEGDKIAELRSFVVKHQDEGESEQDKAQAA